MAGGTTVTGGWLVVNQPTYYEEALTGFASTIVTGSTIWIGAEPQITIEVNPNTQEFRTLGSEDIYKQVIGKVGVKARMTFGIQNSSTTFINYAIRPQAQASGDISRSIQIIWSQKTGQSTVATTPLTTTFFALRGARPHSIKFAWRAGQIWMADVEFYAHSITFSTTGSGTFFLATGGLAADPTTVPWNYVDPGANPIQQFGRNIDTTDGEFTVNRGLKEIYVLGASNVTYLPPTNRTITGTWTAVYASESTLAEDVLTQTTGTISIVMKSGAGTATFTNAVITGHSKTIEIANETFERVTWKAASMSTI